MGVYYYIVNRTKKEIVHYDNHVKHSSTITLWQLSLTTW
jgi:hypothetical protein